MTTYGPTGSPMVTTPPTPSHMDPDMCSPELKGCLQQHGARLPLSYLGSQTPAAALPATPAFCTPANGVMHCSPPSALRRASLNVPHSERLVKVAKGSGVSVYRLERSPREGRSRSPWVIKKSDISPILARERRRVERTLEHESRLLSQMTHPNIVGFRCAQRLPDGKLCLALELCESSLYALIQERQFAACGTPEAECMSPARLRSASTPPFAADEIVHIGLQVARGLAYLHVKHQLLHGDVKSANVLVSRARMGLEPTVAAAAAHMSPFRSCSAHCQWGSSQRRLCVCLRQAICGRSRSAIWASRFSSPPICRA